MPGRLRPARFVWILAFTGHRAQSREGGSRHVHTSLFDDCRRWDWFCGRGRTGLCRRRHRGKSADLRRMPRPEWRARPTQKPFRSSGASSRAISSSNCTTTEVAIATTRSCRPSPKALRRKIFARSRPISRPRAGRRNTRPPLPRRRPTESPSASHAISRISRAARRRRGWQGSVTNTWSQRCATSPPSERTNNGDMPKFMQALTDSERDAMARYLSAL